jgi:hypothetical protein
VVGAFTSASATFLVAECTEASAAACVFRERKWGFALEGGLDLQSLLASKYQKANSSANTESHINEHERPYQAVIVPCTYL